MVGAQVGLESDPERPLRLELAVSYVDHSLRSTLRLEQKRATFAPVASRAAATCRTSIWWT